MLEEISTSSITFLFFFVFSEHANTPVYIYIYIINYDMLEKERNGKRLRVRRSFSHA